MKKRRAEVLIITGPPGAGKTTVAKIVARRLGCTYIAGDDIKKELFPDVRDIEKDRRQLQAVKDELFRRTEAAHGRGEDVVVDYIVLGEEYVGRFREVFAPDFHMKVLLPPLAVILERDRTREAWTAGEESIIRTYRHFEELKGMIGAEHFIDSTGETPAETAAKIRIG